MTIAELKKVISDYPDNMEVWILGTNYRGLPIEDSFEVEEMVGERDNYLLIKQRD